jgi:hypothetical protein
MQTNQNTLNIPAALYVVTDLFPEGSDLNQWNGVDLDQNGGTARWTSPSDGRFYVHALDAAGVCHWSVAVDESAPVAVLVAAFAEAVKATR